MSSFDYMKTMERRGGGSSPPAGLRRREEWGVKAKIISRENTNSRRYSASFIRSSFREDTNKSSFRSNLTISSTASSPRYSQRADEIDPSTYSFTTALQALQARSAYNCWDEGFALNSKWNEAEKYICNPLSGEFPMECLSAKTLRGKSGRMITMSAPLIFSDETRPFHHNLAFEHIPQRLPLQEVEAMRKRDVGTQSKSPPELSSEGSQSPAASTPSIVEKKRNGDYSPPSSSSNAKLVMPQQLQVNGKDTREENCGDDDVGENKEEEEKAKENGIGNENEKDEKNKKQKQRRGSGGGCLSWMSKKQRHRDSHKPRKTFFLLPTLKGC